MSLSIRNTSQTHQDALDALHSTLFGQSREQLKVRTMSPSLVALLFGVDQKAVHRARESQASILKAKGRIDPLSLESLVAESLGNGRFEYSMLDVRDLVDRRRAAAADLKHKVQAAMGLNAVLAFHGWASEAMPDDTWPFVIQPDGRPLESCAALALDKAHGEVEWLTLREFSNKLAQASAGTFHEDQAHIVDGNTLPGREGQKSNSI